MNIRQTLWRELAYEFAQKLALIILQIFSFLLGGA